MTRVSLPLLVVVFGVGIAPIAMAAGGGGSAGGAGAQNQPASGLPLGEAGPLGSTNNPRKVAEPERPTGAPVAEMAKPPEAKSR